MTLDLPPELEQQLTAEAARRGQPVGDCVRTLLEERLGLSSGDRELTPEQQRDAVPDYRELPRGSLGELAELARQQGAPLSVDWDAMPEDPEPDALRNASVAGRVVVRFTVDTAGQIDQSTVQVLESTNVLFTRAVMQVLASFRFKRDTRRELYRPHLDGRQLVISFMTLAELEAWSKERRWGETRRAQLAAYIAGFTIRHSDAALCEWWATVRAVARRVGRPIGVADAWVAATALRYGLSLVTHNPSHFAGVAGLTIITEREP